MQYVTSKIYIYIYSDMTFLWRSYRGSRPQYKLKIGVDNVACVADVILNQFIIINVLILGPQRTERITGNENESITGNAFRFSGQPVWQIGNGFFQ